YVMQIALKRGRCSDYVGSSDIRDVAVDLRSRIHENEVAILRSMDPRLEMQDRRMGSDSDDRTVACAGRAVTKKLSFERDLKIAFRHAGTKQVAQAGVAGRGHDRASTQQIEFNRVLGPACVGE